MGEEFLDPFNSYPDYADITLDKALNSIKDYTVRNFQKIETCGARNYILGGKQNGKYYMCVLHFNDSNSRFELDTVCPSNDDIQYRFLLSPKAKHYEKQFKAYMSDAFETSRTLDKLIIAVVKVIGKIADVDDTVGRKVNCVKV